MPLAILTSLRRRPLLLLTLFAVAAVEWIAALLGGPRPSRVVFGHQFGAVAVGSLFLRYILDDRQSRCRRWIVYLVPVALLPSMALRMLGAQFPLPMTVL